VNLINIIGGIYLAIFWPLFASFIVIFNLLLLLLRLYDHCTSDVFRGLSYYLIFNMSIMGSCIQCMIMTGMAPVWPDDILLFMNSRLMTTDTAIYCYLSFYYFYSWLMIVFSCIVTLIFCFCCCMVLCCVSNDNEADAPADPEDLERTIITTFGEICQGFTGI